MLYEASAVLLMVTNVFSPGTQGLFCFLWFHLNVKCFILGSSASLCAGAHLGSYLTYISTLGVEDAWDGSLRECVYRTLWIHVCYQAVPKLVNCGIYRVFCFVLVFSLLSASPVFIRKAMVQVIVAETLAPNVKVFTVMLEWPTQQWHT